MVNSVSDSVNKIIAHILSRRAVVLYKMITCFDAVFVISMKFNEFLQKVRVTANIPIH